MKNIFLLYVYMSKYAQISVKINLIIVLGFGPNWRIRQLFTLVAHCLIGLDMFSLHSRRVAWVARAPALSTHGWHYCRPYRVQTDSARL